MKTDLTPLCCPIRMALSVVRQHHACSVGKFAFMAGDQAATPPLGIRRLPRRTIMAHTVPHFACSD